MDSRGETRQDQIAAIPLFRDLPARQHRKLASIGVVRSLHKGDIIFHQGEEGTGFYVVISGRVKVFKLSAEGKEQILHIFDAGEPFGEVPVFAGKRFPAHAEALEDSRVFFFQRAAFVGLIQGDPSLALNMLAMLSQRLRRFAALVEDLSLKEVPGRLAAYLLYLSRKQTGRDALTLNMSKAQLAALLGTIPETLSRIFARMTKADLIEPLSSRRIRILDREALEDLADGTTRLVS
jgi:CRP-like cAMP-binding protein